MAELRQVRELARELSATFTKERFVHKIRCGVEAPAGYVWRCGGIHELVDWTAVGWKPDYADLIARMSYGVAPCPTEDCDWCNEGAK